MKYKILCFGSQKSRVFCDLERAVAGPGRTMPPLSARSDVFTRHTMSGFTPVVPHIRYPVTIGLYHEGDNLGLFLAPADLGLIRQLTGLPADDRALLLSGSAILDDAFLQASPGPQLVAWADVDRLTGDADVIHIPQSTDLNLDEFEIPTPVLAAPEHAVPTQLGSQVAIGFADGCHAAVIAPDPQLIQRCITGFIKAYVESATQRQCPTLPTDLVPTVMGPMPPGTWTELQIIPSQRFFALEFARNGETGSSTRWICKGPHHNWRVGWSW